jgi:hypothetical protein
MKNMMMITKKVYFILYTQDIIQKMTQILDNGKKKEQQTN